MEIAHIFRWRVQPWPKGAVVTTPHVPVEVYLVFFSTQDPSSLLRAPCKVSFCMVFLIDFLEERVGWEHGGDVDHVPCGFGEFLSEGLWV